MSLIVVGWQFKKNIKLNIVFVVAWEDTVIYVHVLVLHRGRYWYICVLVLHRTTQYLMNEVNHGIEIFKSFTCCMAVFEHCCTIDFNWSICTLNYIISIAILQMIIYTVVLENFTHALFFCTNPIFHKVSEHQWL